MPCYDMRQSDPVPTLNGLAKPLGGVSNGKQTAVFQFASLKSKKMIKKNETQATGLQLRQSSSQEQVRNYFSKILELKQMNEPFPVNLDDVWRLVYPRKDHAVRVLTEEFIEGEDYQVQALDNQCFPKNEESNVLEKQKLTNAGGDRKSKLYFLSVSCLEYFIAKKVRTVFEVYRRVFHQAVERNRNVIPVHRALIKAELPFNNRILNAMRMNHPTEFTWDRGEWLTNAEYIEYIKKRISVTDTRTTLRIRKKALLQSRRQLTLFAQQEELNDRNARR